MEDARSEIVVKRRAFLRRIFRTAAGVVLGAVTFSAGKRAKAKPTVWQLDPYKCTKCGLCETSCVLELSAVRCVHTHAMCGYCSFCFGYFKPDAEFLGTAAENQLCPTGALQRQFIEEPYYEYHIDESLCTACGKCVMGCNTFGNGSLHLQVRHDVCLNCNECAIGKVCPADAFQRVPADRPYLFKGQADEPEMTWIEKKDARHHGTSPA